MTAAPPAIGLLVIGDEILSGKRTDRHLPRLAELLSTRGLRLAWVEIIGDDPARITATLKRSFAGEDIVFSCGGIGSTPDDHTRRCAAEALELPLVLHPEAALLIRQRIEDTALAEGKSPQTDTPETLHRLRMGEFPRGAEIIPNAFNKVPGFTIRHRSNAAHHFLPGFPVMAGPMMEWVLDTHYAGLFHSDVLAERSLLVFGQTESALTPLMEEIEARYTDVSTFSLPYVGDQGARRHIELGVKGRAEQTDAAFDLLRLRLEALGIEIQMPD